MSRTVSAIALAILTTVGVAFALADIPDVGTGEKDTLVGADSLFARDTYRIDTLVCPFKDEIEYEPGEIECGLLQVPENREKPDSRLIELHFVKINSTWDDEEGGKGGNEEGLDLAPGKREDPVIYLTGGPGAQVTYYVKRLKDHGILKHRDLYILEQRGIGYSGDFCPFYHTRKPEAGNVPSFEEHLQSGITSAIDCAVNATAAGVDLSGYNSFENARDVKALRIALGFESWNVWGISYGSILGQAYIKVDPEGIEAIVLDAIVPLDVRGNPWAWRTVNWYDRNLENLDALCQAQPGCAKRYPDLGKRIRQATLSVKDNPIVVAVKDIESFPTGKAHIFSDVVAFLPFAFMYEQSNYPGLPSLIYAWADAVERRDEEVFKAIALAGGDFFGGSQGMSNAMLCTDADSQVQAIAGAEDIAAYPVLGAAVATVQSYEQKAELCLQYGMFPRGEAEYSAVQTDLPALVIEGEMDPITPPPLAKAILPGFSNGTYVEFPYAGHGPSRSVECAGDMLNAFFDNPTTKPDLSCVDQMEAPEFYAPLFKTSFGPRVMVKALEEKKSLIAPGLWGAVSILVPVISFLVLSFAPLGRRWGGQTAAPAFLARWAAWAAALLVLLSVGIFSGAATVTFKTLEPLLLFGMVPWAKWGAFAGILAGVAGIACGVLTIRAHKRNKLPLGTLSGFLLTACSTISFAVFLTWWDLGLF